MLLDPIMAMGDYIVHRAFTQRHGYHYVVAKNDRHWIAQTMEQATDLLLSLQPVEEAPVKDFFTTDREVKA